MIKGTIDAQKIYDTHSQIFKIVTSFNETKIEVDTITKKVKDIWVGSARNEFESQYELLISKIVDFGETLQEIYDTLVAAEAEYSEADVEMGNQYKMAVEKKEG